MAAKKEAFYQESQRTSRKQNASDYLPDVTVLMRELSPILLPRDSRNDTQRQYEAKLRATKKLGDAANLRHMSVSGVPNNYWRETQTRIRTNLGISRSFSARVFNPLYYFKVLVGYLREKLARTLQGRTIERNVVAKRKLAKFVLKIRKTEPRDAEQILGEPTDINRFDS